MPFSSDLWVCFSSFFPLKMASNVFNNIYAWGAIFIFLSLTEWSLPASPQECSFKCITKQHLRPISFHWIFFPLCFFYIIPRVPIALREVALYQVLFWPRQVNHNGYCKKEKKIEDQCKDIVISFSSLNNFNRKISDSKIFAVLKDQNNNYWNKKELLYHIRKKSNNNQIETHPDSSEEVVSTRK